MRKYIVLLISLFIIGTVWGVPQPIADDYDYTPPLPGRDGTETEVWVDDDYYDADNDGGHEWGVDAFDNIQDALTACVVITDQDEAADLPLINVAGGNYDGVNIDRGARFIGDEVDIPQITGFGTVYPGPDYIVAFFLSDANDVSQLNAHYTVIKNFDIFFDTEIVNLPIYLKGANNLLIENVTVSNADQGISVYGSSNSIIRNNVVEFIELNGAMNGGGIGIYLCSHSGGGAKITQNSIIEDNVINGTCLGEYNFSVPGICAVIDERYGYVEGEVFEGNIIRNNHVFGSYGESSVCIEVGSLFPYMQEAWPQYYNETGLANDDFLDNIVEGNECTGNIWGLSIYLSKNLIVRDNKIVDCDYAMTLDNDNPGIDICFNNFMNCEYNVVLGRHLDENNPSDIYDYHVNDADAYYNWNDTIVDGEIDAKMGDGNEIYDGMGSGTINYAPFLLGSPVNFTSVDDGIATDLGTAGADVNVTLTGADSDNYLEVYQVGTLAHSVVADDDFGASGCNVRSPIVIGILETGSVTAALVFDASGITEFDAYSNPSLKLLKRTWVTDAWTAWSDASASINGEEFTLSNVTDFAEYTIGANSLAPEITEDETVVDPDNVELTFEWGDTGADSYNVYSSLDPYALAADWSGPTNILIESYTASADGYYYRVVPVTGGRELGDDPSAIIGGVTYVCEANVDGTNINVIALPLNPVDATPATEFMASDLGNLIGTDIANTISKWSIYTQSWISASYHETFGWGGDFELTIGESYMIGVLEDCNVVIAGVRPDPESGYLITSELTNANFAMMPLNKFDIDTFPELSNDIDGGTHKVNSISYWNNLTQSWTSKSWSPELEQWIGTDFDIVIGMPYMFFTTEYVAWPTVE
jgi:parallel beta-helix repeat protein